MRNGLAAAFIGMLAAPLAAQGIATGAVRAPIAPGQLRTPPLAVDPLTLALAEIKRLRADIDALKTQVAAQGKTIGDLSVARTFADYSLNDLREHYQNHRHRVNGDVGNGFSTTIDGSKLPLTYMLPIREDAAQYKARETGTPFP